MQGGGHLVGGLVETHEKHIHNERTQPCLDGFSRAFARFPRADKEDWGWGNHPPTITLPPSSAGSFILLIIQHFSLDDDTIALVCVCVCVWSSSVCCFYELWVGKNKRKGGKIFISILLECRVAFFFMLVIDGTKSRKDEAE